MVEMSQSTASSPPEPNAHLAEVTAAIAAAAKVPSARSGGGGGGGAGAEYDAIMAAAAGPVASAFVGLIDGMEGGSGGKDKKSQNSRSNTHMGVQTSSRHMPMRTPLMPHMSYGEKRAAIAAAAKASRKKPGAAVAGGSVFLAGGAADRLHGTSAILAGGRRDGLPESIKMNNLRMAVPPSGANITPQMAAQLGISPALIKERDLAQKIVNNPYGMAGKASTARLVRDLKNGSSNAQEVAQTNPNARPRTNRGPQVTSR